MILTPIFTQQLDDQREAALDAGTAIVLDSPIDPSDKLELGEKLASEVDSQGDRVPDLSPAFEPLPTDPEERSQYEAILAGIEDQLRDAATRAFSLSFLISALFGLLALIPIAMTRRLDL